MAGHETPRRPRPLVEAVAVSCPPPSLRDNTGDVDRLAAALSRDGFSPLLVNPRALGSVAAGLREGGYAARALLSRAPCHWELLDALPKGDTAPLYGLAVDLGSTTIACALHDLETGKTVAETSVLNPQSAFGEDILARIVFSKKPENLRHLRDITRDAIGGAAARLAREAASDPARIVCASVAGNTTMTHFLLGLDAQGICREPYIPAANRFPLMRAADVGLPLHPGAPVFVFPNVGSYFGGDLIAGILASGMHRSEDLSLLVDVGTNAEVVLGNRDWLIACAGAAGPALEGGVVERGMTAIPGAIDRVRIGRKTLEPDVRVIGGGRPAGVCGSGLIDLLSELFASGILTVQGKFDPAISSRRIRQTPDGAAYVLAFAAETADGRDLLVSDLDIGILLKSKAAMYTILSVATAKVGVTFHDIARFYVAGAFGVHIDPEMAVRVGLLPDIPRERFVPLGNTSLLGASMLLLDRALLDDVESICRRVTYLELNVTPELMQEFRGALFLPHTDPRLFPSVSIPGGAHGRDDTP